MAKKKSTKKRKQPQRKPAPQMRASAEGELPVQQAATARLAKPARQAEARVDFARDYGYVYADLKRVGIIAAAMLVILVVLSFIIT
jgi:hypothetical protein